MKFTKAAITGTAIAYIMAMVPAGAAAKSATANSAPADYSYTVKPGDTLFSFGRAYLVDASAEMAVQKLNHIADPRHLPTGKVLHIPRHLLRDETTQASVASFAGPVSLADHGQSLPTQTGVKLDEGAEIITGRNAFITLRLSDGTVVSLPSQSKLRLTHLRRVLLTGSLERDIQLEQGRVDSGVTHMHDPNSNFHVTTPITVSAVRGTQFRVAYAPENSSAAMSVVDGKGAVGRPATDAATVAPAGFGIASTAAGDSGPLALLPAPSLIDPGKVQSGEDLHFALASLAGAQSYHVQIARDAGALDVIGEATSADPDFTLPAIKAGSYFLRVTALDGHGLEGFPDTFAFERVRNSVSAASSASGTGRNRKYQFEWQAVSDGTPHFHFRMMRKGAGAIPVADEVGLTGTALGLTNLPPGEYEWQVASLLLLNGKIIEDWTTPQRLHIFAEH